MAENEIVNNPKKRNTTRYVTPEDRNKAERFKLVVPEDIEDCGMI